MRAASRARLNKSLDLASMKPSLWRKVRSNIWALHVVAGLLVGLHFAAIVTGGALFHTLRTGDDFDWYYALGVVIAGAALSFLYMFIAWAEVYSWLGVFRRVVYVLLFSAWVPGVLLLHHVPPTFVRAGFIVGLVGGFFAGSLLNRMVK